MLTFSLCIVATFIIGMIVGRCYRPRAKRSLAGTYRLSVLINEECAQVIRNVKMRTGENTTDVVRRAFATLSLLEARSELVDRDDTT